MLAFIYTTDLVFIDAVRHRNRIGSPVPEWRHRPRCSRWRASPTALPEWLGCLDLLPADRTPPTTFFWVSGGTDHDRQMKGVQGGSIQYRPSIGHKAGLGNDGTKTAQNGRSGA